MTDNGHSTLAAALAAFQANLPTVAKSKKALVKHKDGQGSHTYMYADLADISAVVLPRLGAVGLSFSCWPTTNPERRFVLSYCLAHSSGQEIHGEYPLPQSGTAQDMGSAITYARRYALCSVVGVAPDEDDDGAAAVPVEVSPPTSRVWDDHPSDQRLATDIYQTAIKACVSVDSLNALAKDIDAARTKGEISKAQTDQLRRAWAAQRAEIALAESAAARRKLEGVTGENPVGHARDS